MERRLAAILAADVVGYSKHMEAAEEAAAKGLAECQSLINQTTTQLGGRVFNRAGDSALAEFSSPVNAVRCGVEIQRNLGSIRTTNESLPIHLRVGVHFADVIVSGNDLIGDGVNIAARIQEVAEPDSVFASQLLFEQVRRQSPFMFEDLGPYSLKNISEQIRLYKVTGDNPTPRFLSVTTKDHPSIAEVRAASIAVLPFAVTGDDEEQRYFADGLTDDVIVELARFKKLFVSSRSASFAYAAKCDDPCKAGRELGVRTVLEGQIRRLGNQVRLSVRLIDTQSGDHLWAERFVRPLDELFDLLDELVGRIVGTIVGRVEAARIAEARRKRPEDMTAFDFLLRGLEHHRLGRVTLDNEREAVKWFERAIAEDPNYGLAYAWYVCAASGLPEFDEGKGFKYIQKAMELDENEAEIHRIMGAYQMFYRDFVTAEHHYLRAMELNPSDAYLKALSAKFYIFKGEPGRALDLVEEAAARDPFLPGWCVEERGVALHALRRFQEALQALSALPFQTFRSRCYEAACRAALGDEVGAKSAVTKALQIYPELTMSILSMLESYLNEQDWQNVRDPLLAAGLPE